MIAVHTDINIVHIFPIILLINFIITFYILRSIIRYRANWLRILLITALSTYVAQWLICHILQQIDGTISLTHLNIAKLSINTAVIIILIYGWTIAIEISALIISEMIKPSKSTTEAVTFFLSLPQKIRLARRMLHIVSISFRHGLIPYFKNSHNKTHQQIAIYLRETLQEGGLIFIKLGQFLASRSDLIPSEYVAELSKLQTEVPPESWEQVSATLTSSWQAPISDKVASIEHTPTGAASVAQVHFGTLFSGSSVAIKIQRMNAARTLAVDGAIILQLGKIITERAQWAQQLNIYQLCEGFVQSLNDELDQTVELHNLRTMRRAIYATNPQDIRVPGDVPSLSTRQVLVMEKLDGVPLSKAHNILASLSTQKREKLAIELIDVILSLLFRSGIFHADLHPGNILISKDGKLGLLDFGMVGRLDQPTRNKMLLLLLAIERQDSYTATQALLGLVYTTGTIDERSLQDRVADLIMKYSQGFGAYSGKSVLIDIMSITAKYGLSMPSNLSYGFRCISTLEGSVNTLAPNMNVMSLVRQRAMRIVEKKYTFSSLKDTILYHSAVILPILEKMPQRFDRITRDLQDGNLKIKMSILDSPKDQHFINKLARLLGTTLLAMASVVSGVLLLISSSGPMLTKNIPLYSALGTVFVLVGFVASMRALAISFHSELRYKDSWRTAGPGQSGQSQRSPL